MARPDGEPGTKPEAPAGTGSLPGEGAGTPEQPSAPQEHHGLGGRAAPGRRGAASRPKRGRLDVALVERGLESSRERARRLIVAGEVTVNGEVARAPATLVAPDADITLGKTLPYVGRGGVKLAHALDRFGIAVAGRVCLDAGASTGGFTDCLLQRGAARVYAVDVGKGQLAWTLRQDPRVVVMEGVNVRSLRLALGATGAPGDRDRPADSHGPPAESTSEPAASRRRGAAPPASGAADSGVVPEPVSLVVVDVAFISLRLVLPALAGILTPDGEHVALIKPQFEAGQADVGKGGVVRRPEVHRRVLRDVIAAVRDNGLVPAGLTASPIRGQAGNVEFLLWARRAGAAGPPALDTEAQVAAAIDRAMEEATTSTSQ